MSLTREQLTRKQQFLYDCLVFMRNLAEATPAFQSQGYSLSLPSQATGYINFFQDTHNKIYKGFKDNKRALSNYIVEEILDPPSVAWKTENSKNMVYELIFGGAVAKSIIEQLRQKIPEDLFDAPFFMGDSEDRILRYQESIQNWIKDCYQEVINFIVALLTHLNSDKKPDEFQVPAKHHCAPQLFSDIKEGIFTVLTKSKNIEEVSRSNILGHLFFMNLKQNPDEGVKLGELKLLAVPQSHVAESPSISPLPPILVSGLEAIKLDSVSSPPLPGSVPEESLQKPDQALLGQENSVVSPVLRPDSASDVKMSPSSVSFAISPIEGQSVVSTPILSSGVSSRSSSLPSPLMSVSLSPLDFNTSPVSYALDGVMQSGPPTPGFSLYPLETSDNWYDGMYISLPKKPVEEHSEEKRKSIWPQRNQSKTSGSALNYTKKKGEKSHICNPEAKKAGPNRISGKKPGLFQSVARVSEQEKKDLVLTGNDLSGSSVHLPDFKKETTLTLARTKKIMHFFSLASRLSSNGTREKKEAHLTSVQSSLARYVKEQQISSDKANQVMLCISNVLGIPMTPKFKVLEPPHESVEVDQGEVTVRYLRKAV